MRHNIAVPPEPGVLAASSSKPLGATSEANEPVIRPAAFSFSKDAQMTGTAHAENTTTPSGEAAAAAKSKPQSIREFERDLRDLMGYSQREARRIAEGGFKAIGNDEPNLAELATAIAEHTKFFKVPT